ncbi:hypothetical protein [Gelidibacter maritimus]|uniref:Uncharacterized protein n=1 Tax=Gelidibacter maritimus TaxID=2761487 RepID=A0A7W2M463_9FLAO|nr:hypothetical protein [Gelidibacter maritimus]MBA6152151.1 hypothetical protein [Gelidibacter maritimus]
MANILSKVKEILKILLFTAGFSSYAQQVKVSGKVTDTLQNPLAYANILALPEDDSQDVLFVIIEIIVFN